MEQPKNNRFTDLMGAEPLAPPAATRPSVVRIRANGAAAFQRPRTASEAEQIAWFGGVVFGEGMIFFDEGKSVFIVAGQKYTPTAVYEAVGDGTSLV